MMRYADYFSKIYLIFFILMLSVLIIVWPLPGTIAIRHIAMLLALLVGFLVARKQLKFNFISQPVIFLAIFFVWVLAHYIFFSQNQIFEYSQLISSWIRILVSTLLGLVLASQITCAKNLSSDQSYAFLCIPAALLSIPCMIIFFNWSELAHWCAGGDSAEFWQKPYGDKHSIVFYGVVLIGCIFATVQYFALRKKIYLYVGVGGVLIYLFAFSFANTKNGFGIFLLQLFFFWLIVIFSKNLNKKVIIKFLLGTAIIIPVILEHFDRNSSWKQIIDDVAVGYQIEFYPHWQRYEYGSPLNKRGQIVSSTNYERVAWGTAGLRLLLENPMGYGLIKQSFGYLAIKKWPNIDPVKVKSTHSGWIDFALAYGIPGISLVFLSIFFSLNAAWRNRNEYWGILSLWVLPTTVFVWLVAELCTNHFVEMLFMILGFFSLVNNKSKNNFCEQRK